MGYRTVKTIETYCDGCGKIRNEAFTAEKWSIWHASDGVVLHHCPACIEHGIAVAEQGPG